MDRDPITTDRHFGQKLGPSESVISMLVIPREAADEVLIKALKKAAGEKTVRKAIEDGMSATDAFAKFGIL